MDGVDGPDRACITALTRLGGDPVRIAVKAGDQTIAIVAYDVVQYLGLQIGSRLTDDVLDMLDTAADELKARHDALRLLSTRSRSRDDLARRLRRKG